VDGSSNKAFTAKGAKKSRGEREETIPDFVESLARIEIAGGG